MTAPDRLAKTLIKTLANRGHPLMTEPQVLGASSITAARGFAEKMVSVFAEALASNKKL
jgi:hypothetical protein